MRRQPRGVAVVGPYSAEAVVVRSVGIRSRITDLGDDVPEGRGRGAVGGEESIVFYFPSIRAGIESSPKNGP